MKIESNIQVAGTNHLSFEISVPREFVTKIAARICEDLEDVKDLSNGHVQEICAEVTRLAVIELQKKHHFEFALDPEFQVNFFRLNQDLKFSGRGIIHPQFHVNFSRAKELASSKIRIEDSEVDLFIERLRTSSESEVWGVMTRQIANNDEVELILELRKSGEESFGTPFTVTEDLLHPKLPDEIKDRLVGKIKGSTIEVKVTFPFTYSQSEIAGSEYIARIYVKAVRKKQDQDLTDEFAKSYGMENLTALKASVKKYLLNSEFERQAMLLERKLFDILIADNSFEVPAELLEFRLYKELSAAGRISHDNFDYLDPIWKVDLDRMDRLLREEVLIRNLARQESIELEDLDRSMEQARIALSRGYTERQVAEILKDPDELKEFDARLLRVKVVDSLLV